MSHMSHKDHRTLSLNFGEDEVEKVKEILRRMGDFIAYFEVAEEKMNEWQRNMELVMEKHHVLVNDHLIEIRESTEELRNIMTEAGAARWRIAAEAALQQGKDHLRAMDNLGNEYVKSLHASNQEFAEMAKKSFERLDRASSYTIKNISEAISSFRIGEFQRLTDHTCEVVEEASTNAINRLNRLIGWFQWKNIGLAFVITLFVSLTMGLYLTDEMPWEAHSKVAMERHAGEALMKAWPTLSENERRHIIQHARRTVADQNNDMA